MMSSNKQNYPTRVPLNSGFKRCWWPHPLFNDIFQLEYTEDPDVVFLSAPGSHSVGKIHCKTGEVFWIASVEANGISYHPRARRLIAADRVNNRLIEFDADTGKEVRTIDRTNLGSMGHVWGVHYLTNYAFSSEFSIYQHRFYDDPDLVAIADAKNHIAGVLRLSTSSFEYSFGEYGVRGSDGNHLDYPRDLSLFAGSCAWVADCGNHRLVHYDLTQKPPRVNYLWLFPSPSSIRYTFNSPNADCMSGNAVVTTEDFYQPLTLILSDFLSTGLEHYTSLIGLIPIATNVAVFNPRDPLLVAVNQWNSVFEIAWDQSAEQFRHLRRFSKHYLANKRIVRSGEWSSPPIVGLINDRMRIKIYSSEAIEASIETPEPKFRLLVVPPDFRWKTEETISCRGDRVTSFLMEAPLDVYRIRIGPTDEDTTCSVYVEGY